MNCDEDLLSRALGGISKVQAINLAARYREKYNVDLATQIKDRTGGNYCKALVTWITVPDPTCGLEDAIAQGQGHVTAQAITNVKVGCALCTFVTTYYCSHELILFLEIYR